MKIAVLPGDGIGPEIIAEAVKVLNALGEAFEMETAPVGGAGYEAKGHPLPEDTLKLAKEADAICLVQWVTGNTTHWPVNYVLSKRFLVCANTSVYLPT